ncbi:hypothetical protein B0H10DRAFT_2048834, partial [Mycena sp. CBHHK59/15]
MSNSNPPHFDTKHLFTRLRGLGLLNPRCSATDCIGPANNEIIACVKPTCGSTFHLHCVALDTIPTGTWVCRSCLQDGTTECKT